MGYFLNVLFVLLATFVGGYGDVILQTLNQCKESIWIGANPPIGESMWERPPDTLNLLKAPDKWTGNIWARTGCTTGDDGKLNCVTGDCKGEGLSCDGGDPQYPVTMLSFDINEREVNYEVNLLHGYNIRVSVVPDGGSGDCAMVACQNDLLNECPRDLLFVGPNDRAVACKSPCDVYQDPAFCCTGNYTGSNCQPNRYSDSFKRACPLARTYPGVQGTAHRCTGATYYNITFCPILPIL